MTPAITPPPAARAGRSAGKNLEEQIERLLGRLTTLVRRHLEYHEAAGDLRPREVEPSDLAIEAAARALRQREHAPEGRKLYPWLCRIAYRVVEEAVKRRRIEHTHVARRLEDPLAGRDSEHAFEEPVRRLLDVLPAPGPLPEEVVERREFQEYLERQLNRLPWGPALAFLYHDLEGMNYREVGAMFHISPEEARHWARLARRRLAEVLLRDGWVTETAPAALFRPGPKPLTSERRDWMERSAQRATAVHAES